MNREYPDEVIGAMEHVNEVSGFEKCRKDDYVKPRETRNEEWSDAKKQVVGLSAVLYDV